MIINLKHAELENCLNFEGDGTRFDVTNFFAIRMNALDDDQEVLYLQLKEAKPFSISIFVEPVLGSVKDQVVVYECSPHILLLMIYYGLNHSTDGEFSLRKEKLLKDNTVDTMMIRKLVFDIINDALKA